MLRTCHHLLALSAIALFIATQGACLSSTTQWTGSIGPAEPLGGFSFGVAPGSYDGYEGQPLATSWTRDGVHVLLFRTNGQNWSGPTGFYGDDTESPIATHSSHTWWDIRLWSCNYTPIHSNRVGMVYTWGIRAPEGYWGKLVLDYVPASLNWTGETEWLFPLWTNISGYGVPPLPCPITDDPFNPENVTRMHLTVYTYPVPEPSSLAALVSGLAAVGVVVRRRVIR